MITLLIFIFILSILILIHELGHFVAAKKSGILVEEFGLGIPPRIVGKKFGETLYSLNALPFGGFVKLFGEDYEEGDPEITANPRSFISKSTLIRSIILSAGVIMNFVLAITLYYVLFSFTNFKSLNLPLLFDYRFKYGDSHFTETVITGFSSDSPTETSGAVMGEAILEIDGVQVKNIDDVKLAVKDKPNTEVTLLLKDLRGNYKDRFRTISVETTSSEEGEGLLGVYISSSVQVFYSSKIFAPFQHAYNVLSYTYNTFKEFIKISFQMKSVEPVSSGVAGPVGIYSIVGGILSYGGYDALLGIIDFTALLSLSLALLNILPLPALDGGRLFFIGLEVILGKKVNQKVEASVHKWGMLFFFGMLFIITIKDIRRFFPFGR